MSVDFLQGYANEGEDAFEQFDGQLTFFWKTANSDLLDEGITSVKATGGWTYQGTDLDREDLLAIGFKLMKFKSKEGKEYEALVCPELKGFQPMKLRLRWETGETYADTVRWPRSKHKEAKEFNGGKSPRGVHQVIGYLDGIDEPVALQAKGHAGMALAGVGAAYKAHGLLGPIQNVLSATANKLLSASGKNVKGTIKAYAFKVNVGVERDGEGNVKFHAAGTNTTTVPHATDVPEDIDASDADAAASILRPFMVDQERYQAAFTYNEGEGQSWVAAWDDADVQKAEEVVTEAADEAEAVEAEAPIL